MHTSSEPQEVRILWWDIFTCVYRRASKHKVFLTADDAKKISSETNIESEITDNIPSIVENFRYANRNSIYHQIISEKKPKPKPHEPSFKHASVLQIGIQMILIP